MFDVCEKLHISFDDIIDIFVDDDRIGSKPIQRFLEMTEEGLEVHAFQKIHLPLLHTMNRYQIDFIYIKCCSEL